MPGTHDRLNYYNSNHFIYNFGFKTMEVFSKHLYATFNQLIIYLWIPNLPEQKMHGKLVRQKSHC